MYKIIQHKLSLKNLNFFFRNWPIGRSIFHDASRDLVVWINQSDHLVIKSLDKRGNARRAARRLCSFLSALQTQLTFSVHPAYGYLSVSPGRAGPGLEAAVLARLPCLAKKTYPRLRQLCTSYDITIRRQRRVMLELVTGARTHGVPEFLILTNFFNGIRELAELEKGWE